MKAILSSVYCGSIEYYTVLKHAEEVLIDSQEHYTKQTYRNRCEIYGANGKLNLTIPLVRRGQRVPVYDAEIENSHGWNKLHWRSIESAYRSSPYFEFYEHHFIPIFEKDHTHLFELNQEIQNKIIQILNLDVVVKETESYQKEHSGYTDYRDTIHPKIAPKNKLADKRYIQVFESKYGFMPNLSILDLLFNEGPNAISYL
jgi:hypothetical protein